MSLIARDISIGYGGAPVITGAECEAPRGVLTALIGPNGAGKSTLLKAVAGLAPSTGAVEIDGGACDRRAAVAYMPQDTSAASGLTMLEAVMLGRLGALGWSTPKAVVDGAAALLARFGLDELADRPLDAVSGGQRQLAFLAQALFREPEALLLDEPTAALDLRHQLLVLEAMKAHAEDAHVPVVAAMHDLTLVARFADRILCLSRGRIVASGSPEEVLKPELIADVYGVEVDVSTTGGRLSVTPLRAAARQMA
ncbi:MAG: ABC transporter ATP-binding protein [Pseudomonadota bacterium]